MSVRFGFVTGCNVSLEPDTIPTPNGRVETRFSEATNVDPGDKKGGLGNGILRRRGQGGMLMRSGAERSR